MPRNITIKSENEKKEIIKYIKEGTIPDHIYGYKKRDFLEKIQYLKIEDNDILIKDKESYKIYLGDWEDIRKKTIIFKYHRPGHISADKLYDKLKCDYVGITRKMVREYIKKCEACNMAHSNRIQKPLTYISASSTHERLFLDIIDLSKYHQENGGYKYILSCLDSFSKFAFVFPLKNKNAKIVSDKLNQLCAVEGKWKIVHTDNGKEFCNAEFKGICAKYNIEHLRGRPRHPESQGQIERFNGTLKSRLAKSLCGCEQKKWIDLLRDIVHQYNNTAHRAIGTTPFSIFRNLILREKTVDHSNSPNLNLHIRKHMSSYQNSIYKNRIVQFSYKTGDRVLLVKDFDNNIKTRKNPLDVNCYETLYSVIETKDNLVKISDDENNIFWVSNNQLKKIN